MYRIIIFIIVNFGALALGSLFTNQGVTSDWYTTANQAPWTPPGWVFGAAWTTIMICYSFYMSALWDKHENKKRILTLFVIQFVLNVIWNPIFFYFHQVGLALISIILLTVLMGFFLFSFRKLVGLMSILVLPYFIWLCIATSLNGYIFLYN